ncbi:MAG: endonuclease [Bacteroidales bacterium]|nr:endonuclease [Bacteroidales bacterium]
MSEGIVKRINGTLLLLLTISCCDVFPQVEETHSLRFMFWNVENFFDARDDTVIDDDEFLPGGVRRWTWKRYYDKTVALSKVVVAAGGWEAPALVGLSEVENRMVVEDLVRRTGLSKSGYSIIHEDSPDPRGIDVCIMYRHDIVKVLEYRYFTPADTQVTPFRSRSLLYAKFLICEDTVHVFLNHWPSRRGGVLAAESLRTTIAMLLREKADSVAEAEGGGAFIIFAGDFNATPTDRIMNILKEDYTSGLSMINLSALLSPGTGTYRYRGIWEMIDQVLVSERFLRGPGSMRVNPASLRIFNEKFVLTEDPVYPGPSPLSTYRGFSYQGGFSDHLPVLLDIISSKLY